MALNINWRFAGPQNINVPQSNFLNSLDKNIQNALGIKKEFDKKRDDNEMIRLMTEESENKLTNLINEKDELTTQYNLLTADEQLAQKTNYENKLKDLDEQINLARKEVADARMNANQFKTTGTTDFFRWKKDKEYASDVAAMNRDMLNEQNKQEELSNLYWEIKSKEAEFVRSNDKDDKRRLTDEINHLKARANKIAGQTVYNINVQPKDVDTQKDDVPQKVGDIKGVDYINKEIESLTWQENLAKSDAVNKIQTEINKYGDSLDKDKLNQDLTSKIKKLNDDKAAEDEAERKAKAAKAEAARKDREAEKNKLENLRKSFNATELLTYHNAAKEGTEFYNLSRDYLIDILKQTNKPGLSELNNTTAKAAKQKYKDDAMTAFINKYTDKINAAK